MYFKRAVFFEEKLHGISPLFVSGMKMYTVYVLPGLRLQSGLTIVDCIVFFLSGWIFYTEKVTKAVFKCDIMHFTNWKHGHQIALQCSVV